MPGHPNLSHRQPLSPLPGDQLPPGQSPKLIHCRHPFQIKRGIYCNRQHSGNSLQAMKLHLCWAKQMKSIAGDIWLVLFCRHTIAERDESDDPPGGQIHQSGTGIGSEHRHGLLDENTNYWPLSSYMAQFVGLCWYLSGCCLEYRHTVYRRHRQGHRR